jgi:hypothetical protein
MLEGNFNTVHCLRYDGVNMEIRLPYDTTVPLVSNEISHTKGYTIKISLLRADKTW